MILKNFAGASEVPKYRIIIPMDVIEKVLHWSDGTELDYDVQILGGIPVLVIVKKEVTMKSAEWKPHDP